MLVPGALSSNEPETLSSREGRVLRLLLRGFSFAAAAHELSLRPAEVERCHGSLCRKLHLRTRPALYEYALAIGLLRRNGAE